MDIPILAIETATDVCSVAVADDATVLSVVEVLRPRSHAEQLAPAIAEALRLAKVQPADLKAVAVSAGPGSYTGLRIGASTAKGIVFGTDAVLVAVPTLEAMARSVATFSRNGELIVPLLNSRREEVYVGRYSVGRNGAVQKEDEDAVLDINEINEALHQWDTSAVWFVGEGAERVKNTGATIGRAYYLSSVRPSAIWIAEAGAERFRTGIHENVADFEPNYLKDFIAKQSRPILDRLSERIRKPGESTDS